MIKFPLFFSARPLFGGIGLLELKALRGGGGNNGGNSDQGVTSSVGHTDIALGHAGELLGIHNPIYDVQVSGEETQGEIKNTI